MRMNELQYTAEASGDRLDKFISEKSGGEITRSGAVKLIESGCCLVNNKAEGNAFADTESGIEILVEQADGHKCDRCWSYSTEGEETEDGGFICSKCKAVIEG